MSSGTLTAARVHAGMRRLTRRRWDWREAGVRWALVFCTLVSVVTTAGIILVLAKETSSFVQDVLPWDFLFGTRWTPLLEPRSFGVLPLVAGTALVVVGAGLVALPIGLATGIYLSEYASARFRAIAKPVLEILAGIPTVVYGYFALTSVTPLLAAVFPQVEVFNAASGAIVVGIMILPMVATLCEDALSAVPESMRQAGFALGATRGEVARQIVVPGAASGIAASFVLALSRALGETMAVTLASGATPKMTLNPFESIQTMTAYIVQVSLGDTPAGTVEYRTIFAVGSLLFAITLVMNAFAHLVLRRWRRVAE